MLIPIRDENPTSRRAWVTLALIVANVVAFLLWQPTLSSGENKEVEQQIFFFCNAEIPYEVTHQTNLADGGEDAARAIAEDDLGIPPQALQEVLREGIPEAGIEGCPDKSWLASMFAAMFLHGGFLHIAGNMLYLWIFGNNVEDKLGPVKFLLFYLFAGLVASGAQIATSPNSVVPTLGASGAVAGVLGAYLVMFPKRRVLSIVPIIFIYSLIALPAVVVLGFWILLQFLNGATALSDNVNAGVAYWAHIGGFVAGVVLALLFFPKERRREIPESPVAW